MTIKLVKDFITRHTLDIESLENRTSKARTTGRFNPFHNPHYDLVKLMYQGNPNRDVTIHPVVGRELNQANLFDSETTQQAITACYPEINVIPIPPLTPRAGLNVLRILREDFNPGDMYAGGDLPHQIIAIIFGGFELMPRERSGVSATEVRELMIADDDGWKEHIPAAAVPIYQEAMNHEEFKIAKDIPVRARYFGLVKS